MKWLSALLPLIAVAACTTTVTTFQNEPGPDGCSQEGPCGNGAYSKCTSTDASGQCSASYKTPDDALFKCASCTDCAQALVDVQRACSAGGSGSHVGGSSGSSGSSSGSLGDGGRDATTKSDSGSSGGPGETCSPGNTCPNGVTLTYCYTTTNGVCSSARWTTSNGGSYTCATCSDCTQASSMAQAECNTSPPPPDAGSACAGISPTGIGACDSCLDASCCSQVQGCMQNSECLALDQCLNGCTQTDASAQTTCQTDCQNAHPNGVSALSALASCAQSSCASTCQ